MKAVKIAAVLFFLVLLTPCALGAELEEYIAGEYCPDISDGIAAAADPDALFDTFGEAFSASLEPMGSGLGWLCCAIILAAVFRVVRDALTDSGGELYDLCSSLVCALVLFGTVKSAYDAVSAAFTGIQALMTAMLAAMTAIYGLSGNFIAGSANISTLMLVLQVLEFITTSLLLPLVSVCFGFCLLGPFSFSAGADELVGLVKRTVNFILTTLSAALGIVLGYQSILAKTADTVLLRSVKFSVSGFVPIVGASLSESLNAVAAAVGAVKASAGLGGIISLCALLLPPVLTVIAERLMLGVAGFLCDIMKLDGIKKLTEAFDGILSMLLALCVSAGIILILACALFSVS